MIGSSALGDGKLGAISLVDAASAATRIRREGSSVSKETARRIGLSTRMDSPASCEAAAIETDCGAERVRDAEAVIVVAPAEEDRLAAGGVAMRETDGAAAAASVVFPGTNNGRKRPFSAPFDRDCAGARVEVATAVGDVGAVGSVADADACADTSVGAGVSPVGARTADAFDVERASTRLALGATRACFVAASALARGAVDESTRPAPAGSAGCEGVATAGAAMSKRLARLAFAAAGAELEAASMLEGVSCVRAALLRATVLVASVVWSAMREGAAGEATNRDATAARGASVGVAASLRSETLVGGAEAWPARDVAAVQRGGAVIVEERGEIDAEARVVVGATVATGLASTADRDCGVGAEETCIFARDAAGRKLSSCSVGRPARVDASSWAGDASSWGRGASATDAAATGDENWAAQLASIAAAGGAAGAGAGSAASAASGASVAALSLPWPSSGDSPAVAAPCASATRAEDLSICDMTDANSTVVAPPSSS